MTEASFEVNSLYFIIGFVAGAVLCFIALTRFFKGHRIKDELLKSRRDLANAQRSVDEFLAASSELFAQLDASYRRYAAFMHSASERMSTLGDGLFTAVGRPDSEAEKTGEERRTPQVPAEQTLPASGEAAAQDAAGKNADAGQDGAPDPGHAAAGLAREDLKGKTAAAKPAGTGAENLKPARDDPQDAK